MTSAGLFYVWDTWLDDAGAGVLWIAWDEWQ
ncbi:hypothetical protein QFZ50_002992 [Arthrobacter agilis]|nr:hypothetical protein [Arthrobacter agilis]